MAPQSCEPFSALGKSFFLFKVVFQVAEQEKEALAFVASKHAKFRSKIGVVATPQTPSTLSWFVFFKIIFFSRLFSSYLGVQGVGPTARWPSGLQAGRSALHEDLPFPPSTTLSCVQEASLLLSSCTRFVVCSLIVFSFLICSRTLRSFFLLEPTKRQCISSTRPRILSLPPGVRLFRRLARALQSLLAGTDSCSSPQVSDWG